jgi:hypothetical protein
MELCRQACLLSCQPGLFLTGLFFLCLALELLAA